MKQEELDPVPEITVGMQWDFETRFPPPLNEAIDNGKLDEGDVDPENLAALHRDYMREGLTLLADVDAVAEAHRFGVHPVTGKVLRTQGQRDEAEKLYELEPARLRHAFDVLLDVYAECFGDDPAAALRFTLKLKNVGVVVSTGEPDETCSPTTGPSTSVRDRWGPGHPWHYHRDGDAATPMPPDEIRPVDRELHLFIKLPADPLRREQALEQHQQQTLNQLNVGITRYVELITRGPAALSNYDRTIGSGGDEHMAWAQAVALKHNHIAHDKARLNQIRKLIEELNPLFR